MNPAKGEGLISIGVDQQDLFWIFIKSNKKDKEWRRDFENYIPTVIKEVTDFLSIDQIHRIEKYNA
ncbi:MAG: hypothetical protein ABJG47_11175 [Ekhidna sp.]